MGINPSGLSFSDLVEVSEAWVDKQYDDYEKISSIIANVLQPHSKKTLKASDFFTRPSVNGSDINGITLKDFKEFKKEYLRNKRKRKRGKK